MGMICSIYAVSDDDRLRFDGNSDELLDFMEEAEDTIDLDMAWHAIHFLLTGSVWEGEPPLNFVVTGGSPIAGSDTGYGEVRFFGSGEVKAVSEALDGIFLEVLLHRYDAKRFSSAEIYPSIWDRISEEEENKEYIGENYEQLRSYIGSLAKRGSAMMVSIQ